MGIVYMLWQQQAARLLGFSLRESIDLGKFPSGMTRLDEDSILAGFTIVTDEVRFDSDIGPAGSDGGNAVVDAPIPSLFYVRKLFEDARL